MKTYLMGLLRHSFTKCGKKSAFTILFLLLSLCSLLPDKVLACGEAGTYFNFYVPPNNEIELRDVAVVVTAIYDNTKFRINDTGEDGDTDDSASGTLMSGQSYVLYLRNGINDDAPHAGEPASKQDGDHFIVTSNQLVLVSQSTASDWQHNWLAADNKTSMGKKFFIFATKVSESPNDINVMAYEDSTFVTVTKISTSPTLEQGFTSVSYTHDSIVLKRMLSPGQDLIYYFHDGRDLLQSGETYLVQTNKNVTVQYGALYTDEHDGGGYVPSSAGGSLGELFYLTVPFQDTVQQEIRIVSESNNNNVTLARYSDGQWIMVDTFNNLSQNSAVEWVGKTRHETYPAVFRITCTKNKNVKVFEGNWIETGSMNTSDIAAMATSTLGTTSGQDFLEYMPIPANEGNITDPFTGNKMAALGTHAYIFGNPQRAAHVTVKDAYTNGKVINRTYTVPANYYADCALDSLQWLSIYNGTGNPADGPARPYLHIQSDQPVSVMISNHNNDWTMYMGSSVGQSIIPIPVCYNPHARCGDTVHTYCRLGLTGPVNSAVVKQTCDDGMTLLSAMLIDSTSDSTWNGMVSVDTITGITNVIFPIINLMDSSHVYAVQNTIMPTGLYHTGKEVALNTVLSVSTSVTGIVDSLLEMANGTTGIVMQTADTTCLHLSAAYTASGNNVIEKENVELTALCNTCIYTWNIDSTQTETGQHITYDFPAPGVYNIALTVSDSTNSCTASSSQTFKAYAAGTTGINAASAVNDANIWSAGNMVYVNLGNKTGNNATISIYNELGQLVSRENAGTQQIYSHQFGAYAAQYLLVNVVNNGNLVNKKVFITGHR